MITGIFKLKALALSLALGAGVPNGAGEFDFRPWDDMPAKPGHALILKPSDVSKYGLPHSLADALNRDARISLKRIYAREQALARALLALDTKAQNNSGFFWVRAELAEPWAHDKDDKINRLTLTPDETRLYGAALLSQMHELSDSAGDMIKEGLLDTAGLREAEAIKKDLWSLKNKLQDTLELITPAEFMDAGLQTPFMAPG